MVTNVYRFVNLMVLLCSFSITDSTLVNGVVASSVGPANITSPGELLSFCIEDSSANEPTTSVSASVAPSECHSGTSETSWCRFAQGEIYNGYTTHCGLDFYHGDISNYRVDNVDQCLSFCDCTPGCAVVSYQVVKGDGFNGMCWLKNHITSQQRPDSWILGMHKKNISYTLPSWFQPGSVSPADVPSSQYLAPMETTSSKCVDLTTTSSYVAASSSTVTYRLPSSSTSSSLIRSLSSTSARTSIGPRLSYSTPHWCYPTGCSFSTTTSSPSYSSPVPSQSLYNTWSSTQSKTTRPTVTTKVTPRSTSIITVPVTEAKATSTRYPTPSRYSIRSSSYSCGIVTGKIICSSGYDKGSAVTVTTLTTRLTTDTTTTTAVVYQPASSGSPRLATSFGKTTSTAVLSKLSQPATSTKSLGQFSSSFISDFGPMPTFIWKASGRPVSSSNAVSPQATTAMISAPVPALVSQATLTSEAQLTSAPTQGYDNTAFSYSQPVAVTLTVSAPTQQMTYTISEAFISTAFSPKESSTAATSATGSAIATLERTTPVPPATTSPSARLDSGTNSPPSCHTTVTKSVTAAGTWAATPSPPSDFSGASRLVSSSFLGMAVVFVSFLLP